MSEPNIPTSSIDDDSGGDLSHHIYEVDELVVGSSLEAVSYAFLNQKHIILNDTSKPYFFDFYDAGDELDRYLVDDVRYELASIDGPKIVGTSKLEVWEKLVFCLSLAGLVPVSDKVYSMRIENDNIFKITTNNSRVLRFKFNKLRIFDSKNISDLQNLREVNNFRVIDWIDVRSGMKHEYDYLGTEEDFVKDIYFYPSPRTGDGQRKDLVAVSYITSEQLEEFEYSDTYVKFKVLDLMKKAGIRGARNGKRPDDPEKYSYHSIKIEPSRREIQKNEKPAFESKESIVFDYRKEREIYSQSDNYEGYLNRISEVVSA
tara:strand:+ start:1296 stop:2246 length:951 start_codon:yes stop_codon:yes gene_type:complete